ncbi:MAG: DUF3592 domain-containing protein [Alphaproteobacteria bacterium]|nr:DUF3592 domain-containing protein [Alphaproteobacteria bacterium]
MTKLTIILLFLACVVMVLIWQGKRYEKFEAGAKKVMGKVERKDERKLRPNQPSHKENWLVYSYEVEGKPYAGEDKIEFTDLWMDYSVGGDVEIYYNEANPKESHPAEVFDRRIGMTRKLTN